MFKFFKRDAAPAAKPARSDRPSSAKAPVARRASRPSGSGAFDPLPLPQVQELHDESAWDEWEHSQMELDSRMGPLSAFDSVRVKDASPSRNAELDPFAGVRTRQRK